jgi:putative endonuclease
LTTAGGDRTEAGRGAESAACDYLLGRGLVLLERNFRVAGGEIDLIMSDGDVIVFVEVRARRSGEVMHPAESIDRRKQRRLLHTATRWLQQRGLLHTASARFDVVCILGDLPGGRIEWLRNAFQA